MAYLEDKNRNSTIVRLGEDNIQEELNLQAWHVQKAYLIWRIILFTP